LFISHYYVFIDLRESYDIDVFDLYFVLGKL